MNEEKRRPFPVGNGMIVSKVEVTSLEPTLLPAELARHRAKTINETLSNQVLHKVIEAINEEINKGRFFVILSEDLFNFKVIEELSRLGYTVIGCSDGTKEISW